MAFDVNDTNKAKNDTNKTGSNLGPVSSNKVVAKIAFYFSLLVLLLTLPGLTYLAGKKSEHKVRYFSELMEKTRGTKVYLLDMEIVCSNGKDLGRMKADLDLTNGKLVIVRNDNELYPNCEK